MTGKRLTNVGFNESNERKCSFTTVGTSNGNEVFREMVGFFHAWAPNAEEPKAIVEAVDGQIYTVNANTVKFDDPIAAKL